MYKAREKKSKQKGKLKIKIKAEGPQAHRLIKKLGMASQLNA